MIPTHTPGLGTTHQHTLYNLTTIFDSMSHGVVLQDASGTIIECNASAERILGATRTQMMGPTSMDPDWRAIRVDGTAFLGSEHPAMVALASGEPQQGHVMGVRRPGRSLTWISIDATPIREADGSLRVVSVFSDITSRLEAERELVQSRLQLRSVREAQAHFIAGQNPSDVFSRVLDTLLSLTQSEHGFIGEVLQRPDGTSFLRTHAITNSVRSKDARASCEGGGVEGLEPGYVESLVSHAIASGEMVISNAPTTDPRLAGTLAGHAPLNSFLAIPVRANDRLLGLVGIANRPGGYDELLVTSLNPYLTTFAQFIDAMRRERDRATMQRSLQESESSLRLVLDATGMGRWDWNPQTDQATFDEQWAAMIGYAADEIEHSGAQWVTLLHPDDLVALKPVLDAHLRGETTEYRAEFRMRHKQGHWVWLLALGRVVERDHTGKPTRVVGVHVDINSQKDTEAALAQARDAAERANRAKSEFLANMSHEIRTPMNGVIGVAHLLLSTGLDDEQRELAETMMRSGEVLLSLIDDVLDFSKIEADRLVLERVAFDPRETIADAMAAAAPHAEAKGIDLVVDWACEPLTTLTGDPKRLRQVLMNLVSNGVKFSSEGAVVMRIERQPRGLLRIAVIDSGIGIPEDKQATIFEKFVQADNSTTRRFGGSGLGLAISRRLVEAMGGSIGVVSTPGEGSTFWFTLPECASSEGSAEGDEAAARLAGARVLVVSKCQPLGESWQRILRRGTPHVDVWPSVETVAAELAAATVREKPYDLVVFDAGQRAGSTGAAVRNLAVDTTARAAGLVVVAPASQRHELRQLVAGSRSLVLGKPVLRDGQLLASASRALDRRTTDAGGPPRSSVEISNDRRTTGEARHPRRLRVLLAEDNEVNRLVATKMLRRAGCEVDVAGDGRAAVAMAGLVAYDVVFMDCDMPEMDGFEATALLRARAADAPGTAADVPIIALTANALVGDRERCLASGMSDHIAKPIVPRAVTEALARWVTVDGRGPSEDSLAS